MYCETEYGPVTLKLRITPTNNMISEANNICLQKTSISDFMVKQTVNFERDHMVHTCLQRYWSGSFLQWHLLEEQ